MRSLGKIDFGRQGELSSQQRVNLFLPVAKPGNPGAPAKKLSRQLTANHREFRPFQKKLPLQSKQHACHLKKLNVLIKIRP
jgi:hypothetical protein